MEILDAIKVGLIFAIQAEIEGMKAENEMRKLHGNRMAHNVDDFQAKADELKKISYCHNDQL